MQIRELEKELGLSLFERRPRGVRLTEAGHEIAERAVRILGAVRDLGDYARHHHALLSGSLNLGVIPSLAPYLLPPFLPLLRERYPELDLRIRETQTQPLLEQLLDGTLDVLLLALPIERPDVETIRLFDDRFLLAMPHHRRITSRVKATPDLLNNDRLLLLEEGHCLRDQALAFCELRKVDKIDTFGASSLSTIVQMVANGMGLTLLPEVSIGVEAAHGEVGLMRFEEPEPARIVGLAWRSTSPRKREFVEFGKLITQSRPKCHSLPK
jgi:LysR family hydrogen peroxide-inducible transcriptional activator